MHTTPIGINYTAKQVKEMLVANQIERIPGTRILPRDTRKKVVSNFGEFDEHTASVYVAIYRAILELNPNQEDLKVWATGSRVKGTWRTKEEEDEIAAANKCSPKYSDYDYCSNAKNLPSTNLLEEKLKVKIDFAGCEHSEKVLIQP